MHRFGSLLLDVWREACRHIEIEESTATITQILRRRLPIAHVIVRRIDAARSCIETVAEAEPAGAWTAPDSPRTDLTADQLAALLAWCRRRRVWRHAVGQVVPAALQPVVAAVADADFQVGILKDGDGVLGVLLLTAEPARRFTAEHETLLEALLEPFTAALENDRRLQEVQALRAAAEADKRSLLARLGREDLADEIVGADAGLRHVMERVDLVSRSDIPVLILGETGAGKELVARAIRNRSPRASGPFMRVNCGSIPAELIDSELFGHERGSFTGAVSSRQGWFERAHGGTLFLDEIGELPLAAQVRLLRVLQDGCFERVGGRQEIKVDVRIIAATHRDLTEMVRDGRFREDLWYRIAVFPILIPPLRDRHEDIPPLAAHFAGRAAKRFGLPLQLPSPADLDLLLAYDWPGNIRELATVIDRAALLGNGRGLEVAAALGVPAATAGRQRDRGQQPAADRALPGGFLTLDAAARHHIEAALSATRGRVEGPHGAAVLLAINPHTLRARMRKLGIDWKGFRTRPSAA